MVKLSSKIYRFRAKLRKLIRRVGQVCQPVVNKAVRWWRRYDRRWYPWWRLANGLTAVLMLIAIVVPVWQVIYKNNRYQLSDAALSLVGATDQNLQKQLTYDAASATYQFNKSAIKDDSSANPLAAMKAQVGSANGQGSNKSLYALDVPADFTKGVTYHDINSGLSFGLTPQFSALPGKTVDGHLVFPADNHTQAVYTLKGNGLKEDIVVNQVTDDKMSFDYQFNLPSTLAVKAIPNGGGAIGIYSADPSLFGNISYGSDADRAAVAKARTTGDKTYLVFGLPKPVVKDTKGNTVGSSRYELNGDKLTVVAEGLSKASGPLTIDPSVIVTSASDFQTGGNNQGMIDFSTAGQITRGGLTGGTVGSWTSTYSVGGVAWNSAAVYNGYVYMTGYYTGSTATGCNYALLNSDGSNNGWQTCTSLTSARDVVGLTAYNGYLYVLGGNNAGTELNNVEYAVINSDGSIGSWNATTVLPVATGFGQSFAYNNYMYYIGGTHSDGNAVTTNYYAPINANGTLGSWTSTTGLPAARAVFSMQQYNGYVYVIGGTADYNLSVTPYNTVYYAQINANGTLGSWQSAPNLPTPLSASMSVAYNGYLYVLGGNTTSSNTAGTNAAIYAQINANGTIGPWLSTTNLNAARSEGAAYVNNGYIYISNGQPGNGVGYLNDTYYAKIDPAGKTNAFSVVNNAFTNVRSNAQTVAYGGYLYVMGGDSGSTPYNTVFKATINSDGTIGAFASTTAFTTVRTAFAAVAYNGYMYVIAGCQVTLASCTSSTQNLATIYKSTISSADGTLGTWSAQTALATARYGLSAVAYNGTMYVIGGINGTTFRTDILYQAFGANGVLTGTWTTSVRSLALGLAYQGAVVNGNTLYLTGGCSAGTINCSSPLNATYTVNFTITGSGIGGDLAGNPSLSGNTVFTNARGFLGATIMNGYIYISGGRTNSTYYSDVQYARLNSDGTVGTWVTSTGSTLFAGLGSASMASYNGYLYIAGGYDGSSYYNRVQIAGVNNGGNGTVGSWSNFNTSNGLCTNYSTFGLVVYNGYIYTISGSCNGTSVGTYYAPLNANGTIGTFTSTNSPNDNHALGGVVVLNGYIYAMSGWNGSGDVGTSEKAQINSDGSLGNWSYLTASITTRDTLGAVTYNKRIYALGGSQGQLVEYAQPNASGDISSWTTGTSLPSSRYWSGVVAYNGYLYALGGGGPSPSSPSNTVIYAKINTDGSLGSWAYTTSFSTPRYLSATAANGFMYLAGGALGDEVNPSTIVQFAPINSDGSLGVWQSATSLPGTTTDGHGNSLVYNGYIYYLGDTTHIYYAPINSIARTGHYSKLVDLGNLVNLSGITYNGTAVNYQTSSPIYYRAAGTDGVFGALNSPGNLAPITVCTQTAQLARYVQVFVTLDDSGGGPFADSSGANSSLTDFTVAYSPFHPAPNVRLRGGKTLQAGLQTVLDTCIATDPLLLEQNLFAKYNFTGNTSDNSGNSNDAVIYGSGSVSLTTNRASTANAAYNFNGGYLITNTAVNDPQNFSLNVWFKTTSTTGGVLVGFSDQGGRAAYDDFGSNYDRLLWMETDGTLHFGIYTVSNSPLILNSSAYNDGNWHMVTATTNTTTGMALYVDGTLADSYTSPVVPQVYTGYWSIGEDRLSGWSGTANTLFVGSLDDIRIYNSVLSTAQITGLYVLPPAN